MDTFKYNYSVVIPHYNSSKLLEGMLKSIPEREDIQVIVVDDCSKEEEIVNLKTLTHTNLEIYFQSSNHGAGAARNVGLEHVKGKWVIVVDADDVFAPNAFEVFDQYKDSEFDYICYAIQPVNIKMQPVRANIRSMVSLHKYLQTPNRKNLLRFKYLNLICRNKMVSYEFLTKNKIRFEESMVNNDVYFGLAVGHLGKNFIAIPNILYYTIKSEGSITRKPRTIEREYLFYLQAQKRNGFYEAIGLKRLPYYRYDFLYVPFMIKKRGIKGAYDFFKYRKEHIEEVKKARKQYLSLLK